MCSSLSGQEELAHPSSGGWMDAQLCRADPRCLGGLQEQTLGHEQLLLCHLHISQGSESSTVNAA